MSTAKPSNNAFEPTVKRHRWRAASVQRYFALAARCECQRAAAQRGLDDSEEA
jgi:hypothetical protein